MSYEYSQTLLFKLEDSNITEIIATIKDNNYNSEIEFINPEVAKKFFSICESWDVLIPSLRINNGTLIYSVSQSDFKAYQYYQYMSLIISFLNNDFKIKN